MKVKLFISSINNLSPGLINNGQFFLFLFLFLFLMVKYTLVENFEMDDFICVT